MKLFYAVLLALITLTARTNPSFMMNADIESAMDDGIAVQAHDTSLESSTVQPHEEDLDNLEAKLQTVATDAEPADDETKLRHPFDIDKFLNELDAFDCDKRKAGTAHLGQAEAEFNSLCAMALEEETFKPLGEFDADPDQFYGYLTDNIYKPLAYNVEKKDSLSDVLKDLIFIDGRNSMIGHDAPEEPYADFENGILDNFARIQGMTSDMDTNHGKISDIMVDLLKRFHIYWNTLRSKNQIDKVKVDTKEIMRNILKEYEVKEKFLYEVTQALSAQIKDAYARFLRAHQSVKLLNIEGPSIIASRLLDRYRTIIAAMKGRKYNYVQFVRELALLTDLQQAYYVINYKLKYSESQNTQSFHVDIFNKIEPIYLDFVASIPDDGEAKTTIKHFTASLLLKMKYTQFLIFNHHGIAVFVNFNRSVVQTLSNTTVKVYYDLINNLMLVPKTCVNMLMLKQCALNEVNKALRSIGSTYMLKRSTGGWGIYSYTHDMIKMLFRKSNDQVFSNWTMFKAYYYENLFSIATNLKQRFMIKDLECVDDLETAIGNTVDEFKADTSNKLLNFGLIDEFDTRLYRTMMEIKANFNKFDNVNRDPALLMQIQNALFTDFNSFEKKYVQDINQDFVNLLERVRNTVIMWRGVTLRAPELSIQVTELPMSATNVTPQVFHSVKSTMDMSADDSRNLANMASQGQAQGVAPNANSERQLFDMDTSAMQPKYSDDFVSLTSQSQGASYNSNSMANANTLLSKNASEDDKKNVQKNDTEVKKERFAIVPQHVVSPSDNAGSPEVSLESGITEFDMD